MNDKFTVVKELTHLNSKWQIVKLKNSYYARYPTADGLGSDTGPFSTVEQAEEFITAVKA